MIKGFIVVLFLVQLVFVFGQFPESNSGWYPKPLFKSKEFMVVSANPLASEAGYTMIKKGGNVFDALVSVQLVLGLVEPQSSGIGGGAFLVTYNKSRDRVQSFDGRETAPSLADERLFFKNGTVMTFAEALVGGRSVGVPGALKLLEHVHSRYGKLKWAELFQPAIHLATQGFLISDRLAQLIRSDPNIIHDPECRQYFFEPNGAPKTAGTRLKNPKYAKTLERISAHGTKEFYQGEIAQNIVRKVRGHPTNPGLLLLEDLKNYRVKITEPLCNEYSGHYNICTNQPEAGGLILHEILGILDALPEGNRIDSEIPKEKVKVGNFTEYQPTAKAVHLFSEAMAITFADRSKYFADFDLNWNVFLNKSYLAQRAREIPLHGSLGVANPGQFTKEQLGGDEFEDGVSFEQPSTSHISIVDREGNVISMTTSIENQFGSTLMVDGFLLNNQLTDFSLNPLSQNSLVANRVRPGKRPRSAMTPAIIFKDKKFLMSIGCAGGPLIPSVVAKSVVAVLHWNITLQDSFGMPNFGSTNTGSVLLESDHISPMTVQSLENDFNTKVTMFSQPSGIQGLMRHKNVYLGACDPRREGYALGK